MSLRPFAVTTAVAAAAVALSAAVLPARAADPVFTITAEPTTLHPGEATTVSGHTDDPPCPQDGVTVTLSYTRPDGSVGTSSVATTTDASGDFTTQITVPSDAVAGEPAQVQALVADCPAEPTPSATPSVTPTATPSATPSVTPLRQPQGPVRAADVRASNAVDLTIVAYVGAFTTDKTSGAPGTVVHVSGDNCWGGDVIVVFTDGVGADEVLVTLLPDKTFSGDYTIPDAPGGPYQFEAQCPGTDYNPRPFTLINSDSAPPLPRPIPRPVHFTG